MKYEPSDYLTEVPKPPEWMDSLKTQLFNYHCTMLVEKGVMLKQGIEQLYALCNIESKMIETHLSGSPIQMDVYQAHKEFCETFDINNNFKNRVDALNLKE